MSSSDSHGINQKEIRNRTGLSVRNIKYCLSFLKQRNIVLENLVFRDMRCKTYKLRGESG
ncbi:MAG: hypothetical protein J4428_03850 [Candidatus Aenigmarchaeota archaeon]|nr:hypothetical protein [Candidatus Aenigmarchaeota archaeon]